MYEELYAPLPDVGAYLERLGLTGCALPPTWETLCTLMQAHLQRIPFENLDAWDRGAPPALGVPALFDKIIAGRRGGWCFELNGLFRALLDALGYDCYGIGGRVTVGRDYFPPVSHRGTVCRIDGRAYYCDVGFGNVLFRAPVPLDGTASPYGFFARQSGELVEIWQGGTPETRLILFADRPFDPVDYLFANYVNSVKRGLPFRENLMVSALTPDGHRLQLTNLVLRETDGAALIASAAVPDRAALTAVLRERFGIDYAPARFPGEN